MRPAKLPGVVFLLLLFAPVPAWGEGSIEGDPFRGRELLSEKLCSQCHSVWGHGGLLGPDMTTAVAGKSRLDLMGDFWNHTPRMMDAMARRGHQWPTLDREEMADLLAYLYYLRLFDAPGKAERGAVTYSRLRCPSCHSLHGAGGSSGGPLDAFSAFPSPVMLAQAMWNAGPRMQRDQLGRGTDIPTFSGHEMADIQAHIRAEGIRADRRVELMPVPDPAAGANLFEAKKCDRCHRPGGKGFGPDLAERTLALTVSEISGILWNHSYAMKDSMDAHGIPFPRFENTEMADLIAHLYFRGYVRETGDPKRGAELYAERGCAGCHEGPDASASNLAASRVSVDPVALSSAMWNHAPQMHELMDERSVAWPHFYPGDMPDMASYLRALASGDPSD